MTGSTTIKELRNDLSELMTSLEQNQKDKRVIRKINTQISKVIMDMSELKKSLNSVR
jgi:hypothetical protein